MAEGRRYYNSGDEKLPSSIPSLSAPTSSWPKFSCDSSGGLRVRGKRHNSGSAKGLNITFSA
ncbi:hypothetical protein RvY_05881 [Ramazzottius varieornatus]|uniref:Uncharacterized protein n=1 Tax=Ramazzottius varieornatus TaxID=947166 RepID=A0A1D1UWM6_RAMVA|nr:hypothetical protein RvY_05881 [Ramazzottius varieornatus]